MSKVVSSARGLIVREAVKNMSMSTRFIDTDFKKDLAKAVDFLKDRYPNKFIFITAGLYKDVYHILLGISRNYNMAKAGIYSVFSVFQTANLKELRDTLANLKNENEQEIVAYIDYLVERILPPAKQL
jgi:hypothetical protein